MGGMIRCFKWLRASRVDPDTGQTWPPPGGEGDWVSLPDGHLRINVCETGGLPYEIGEELWEVEAVPRGRPQPFTDQVPFVGTHAFLSSEQGRTATRARLVRRVAGWSDRTAVAFAEACAARTRDWVRAAMAGADRSVASSVRGQRYAGSREALVVEHAERLLAIWRGVSILETSAFATLASAHASAAASCRATTALMYWRASGETDLAGGRMVAAMAMADERRRQVRWLASKLGLEVPPVVGKERRAVA
jgi:hypothetical protein